MLCLGQARGANCHGYEQTRGLGAAATFSTFHIYIFYEGGPGGGVKSFSRKLPGSLENWSYVWGINY